MTEPIDFNSDTGRMAPSWTPEKVLALIRRRFWLGLLVFAVVSTIAITVALSIPDLYRASATVLVDSQEVSDRFIQQSVTTELETRIQAIQARVMSRGQLTEVIQNLGLYPNLRRFLPMDAVVERMRLDTALRLRGVEAAGRSSTIAFTVSYTGRNPQTVADVANTLVGLYVKENVISRERQASQTVNFLREQLDSVRAELQQQQQMIQGYSRRYADDLQTEANTAAVSRLTSRLDVNSEAQMRSRDRRDRIDDSAAAPGATAPPVLDPTTPLAQLAKAKQERAEMAGKYSSLYPDVIRVNAEIARLEKQVAEAQARGDAHAIAPDPAELRKRSLGQVATDIGTLKQEEAVIRDNLAVYESRLAATPIRRADLEVLSRNEDAIRERYRALLKQYEDARLASSLEQGQNVERFRILDPAIPPDWPTAPNRNAIMLMGLLGGLVAAIAAAIAAEKLDSTFHSADDLRFFTTLPTLASLRHVPTRAARRRRRTMAALATCGALVLLAVIAAASYYTASGNEQLTRLTVRSSG